MKQQAIKFQRNVQFNPPNHTCSWFCVLRPNYAFPDIGSYPIIHCFDLLYRPYESVFIISLHSVCVNDVQCQIMRQALKQAFLVTGSVVFTNVSEIWRQMDIGIRIAHCSSLEWVQARNWYQDLTSYNRILNNESCNMLALQGVILRYVLHVRIVGCRRRETSWSVEYEADSVTLNTAARYSAFMRCGMAAAAGEKS